MGSVLFFISSIAVGLGALSSAYADQPQAVPNPFTANPVQERTVLPWTNEADFHSCDQACLISKGNDALSLQGLYIIRRVIALQNVYQGQNYQQVVNELGPYCDYNAASNADQTAAKTCLRRYIQSEAMDMQAIKSAIIQNQTSQIAYRSDNPALYQVHDGTNYDPVHHQDGPPASKYPQISQALTEKQMTDMYAQQKAQLERLSGEQYQQWAANLPHRPQPEDFCVTPKPIQDPEDPKKTVQTTPMGPNGSCLPDDGKYKEALADYNKLYLEMSTNAQKAPSANTMVKSAPTPAAQTARQAYHEAENEFVQTSNKDLMTRGVAVVSYGQKPRSGSASLGIGDGGGAAAEEKPVPVPKSPNSGLYQVRLEPSQIDSFLKFVDSSTQTKDGAGKTALDRFIENGGPK